MTFFKQFRFRAEYVALKALGFFIRNIPLWSAYLIADALAFLASRVLRIRKQVTLENISLAYPLENPQFAEKTYHKCFRHFIRVGIELTMLPKLDKKMISKRMVIHDLDVLDKAFSKNRGVLFVSGHFGNWEWLGAALSEFGYGITYVVAEQRNKLVENWINELRETRGAYIYTKKNAVKGVLGALKKNHIIAMLSDQDAGRSGIFIDFFGRPASTPRGAAMIHLKTKAPICFGRAVLEKDGKYHVYFDVYEFEDLKENSEEAQFEIMSVLTKRLEDLVRTSPHQWLWLHRRWKTKPQESN